MSRKQYFNEDIEDAIVEFNNTDNTAKKNEIYTNTIHAGFIGIITGMLRRYTFEYIPLPYEDLVAETLTHLYEALPKYKKENGNAYSYFSVACKFYLIQKNDKAYRELKRSRDTDLIDMERSIINEVTRHDSKETLSEFIDEFIKKIDSQLYVIFRNTDDIKIADSLLEIFRNRTMIEQYNKKAIYLMIRDRTGVNTTQISKVVNILNEHYDRLYLNYIRTGNIDVSGSFW